MGKPDKPEGYTFGRPTKYRKEYCQKLIDHMASGMSFESFGATVDVWPATVDQWVKKHPDFEGAKKMAFIKSREFWEKQALMGMWQEEGGPKFNSTVWIFNMKNRFGWRDRVETQQEIKVEPFVIERQSGAQVELGMQQIEEKAEE